MKKNKFGKLQKRILCTLARNGSNGCPISILYLVAFPKKERTISYLTPILWRMQMQKLVRIERGSSMVFARKTYGYSVVEKAVQRIRKAAQVNPHGT